MRNETGYIQIYIQIKKGYLKFFFVYTFIYLFSTQPLRSFNISKTNLTSRLGKPHAKFVIFYNFYIIS